MTMESRQPRRTKKIHILVVDDDTAIRQLLQRGVESCGYGCSIAASGEQALEILKTRKIDVMITDIVMTGMTGIELTRTVRKIRDTDVIVSMVEKRDPYTAGHQQRVARLACAIAREMNLSGHVMEGIGMAGAIHDLGKIAVPAEILSKPTQLTMEEFSLVKSHARAGFEILKNIDFPWPVAQIACQHHERMNGTGYPDGLKGEDILLEARIIAVADTVEAMASHRPYRPALGIDAALEAVNQGKGDLYDAQVVDACTQLFSKGTFRFDEELTDQIWPKP
jgi:HD-GYP domain-containing protein (c-di-GMP phosphodiesterase class II)